MRTAALAIAAVAAMILFAGAAQADQPAAKHTIPVKTAVYSSDQQAQVTPVRWGRWGGYGWGGGWGWHGGYGWGGGWPRYTTGYWGGYYPYTTGYWGGYYPYSSYHSGYSYPSYSTYYGGSGCGCW